MTDGVSLGLLLRLIGCVRPRWRRLLVALVCMVLGASFDAGPAVPRR